MDFSKIKKTSLNFDTVMNHMQSGDLKAATIAIQNKLSGASYDNNVETINAKTINVSSVQGNISTKHKSINVKKLSALTDRMKDFKINLPTMDANVGLAAFDEQPLPDNAQFLKGAIKSAQGNHNYRLYIPSNYAQTVAKGDKLPLIVMLHGCTQSPEDFAAGTRMNEMAEEHNCLIVYPSQPNSANQNRCWNWFKPSDQQQGRGEPAWLAALTKSIIDDYEVDASRVYIAGLSAGAAMAVIMVETYPELFAAVGVHSGLAYRSATDLPSALMAMRQGGSAPTITPKHAKFVPMIVFHGDQDHTVSIRNGNQIVEQAQLRLQAQNMQVSTQQLKQCSAQNCRSTQLKSSDSSGVCQLEYWKIHGAGHSWAGGSSAGSYTDPTGPDASREMLRFFLDR